MPTVVVEMLDALDARPGERILEIGTGTGWYAAVLARWSAPRNVVSLEIDEHLAEQARKSLAEAGYSSVRVITGDCAVTADGVSTG